MQLHGIDERPRISDANKYCRLHQNNLGATTGGVCCLVLGWTALLRAGDCNVLSKDAAISVLPAKKIFKSNFQNPVLLCMRPKWEESYYEGDHGEEKQDVGNLDREEGLPLSLWQHLALLKHQVDEGKQHPVDHCLQKNKPNQKHHDLNAMLHSLEILGKSFWFWEYISVKVAVEWLTNRSNFHLNHHSWMLPFSSKSLEMGHTEKILSKKPWSHNVWTWILDKKGHKHEPQ